MRGKDISISGSTWLHQDKPNKYLALMTLATGLVSLIVIIFLRPNVETVLGTLLLVTLVTLAVFLTQAKTTNIEIDRDKGAVRKKANYLVFTMRKSYPLQEFDSITMLAKDEPAEDGYRIPRYSVVLSGKSRSLELLSADTETEGKAIQKELAEFLGLPAQGTAGGRSAK
jgi:hypothetical protein